MIYAIVHVKILYVTAVRTMSRHHVISVPFILGSNEHIKIRTIIYSGCVIINTKHFQLLYNL